ncbi:acetate kinase [Testudinibacter sp. P27/CKL/0425]
MSKSTVLVLNCGSSSLKFAVIDAQTGENYLSGLAECFGLPDARIKWKDTVSHQVELSGGAAHTEALDFILRNILQPNKSLLASIKAIGHRIAHGGEQYTKAVIINDTVIQGIQAAVDFAPLHNPANLLGIHAALAAFPHLRTKNIAIFDTAFHTTMPKSAYLYALPKALYEQYGIRRYGFHGTSHDYVSKQAARLLQKPIDTLNIISCHLGNGSSVTAIKNGKSVDTSMGFTPCEGLVMGTRCGDLDPSILLFLMEKLSLSTSEVSNMLNKQSGFLGISGMSNDCRYLTEHYDTDSNAKNALDIYVHRLAKYIGGYSTLLNGRWDALVFTGGIGENSVLIRQLTVEKLSILGFELSREQNEKMCFGKTGVITSNNSLRPAWVIPTNEELVIAQQAMQLVT